VTGDRYTYNAIRKEDCVHLDSAKDLYQSIKQTRWTSLKDDLVRSAVRYARLRTDWALATPDQRLEMDRERSRAHTAFIDCCNILSRNMGKAGEDNSWRMKLGDDRKDLGDFACYLHCLLGILSR